MTGRHVDFVLAGLLAILPLLPTGPAYLGLPDGPWVELLLLGLAGCWALSRLVDPPSPDPSGPVTSVVGWGLLPFVAVISGAALVGLASDNILWSPVFLIHLQDAPARFLRPVDQIADPLYAARIWATMMEGAVACVIVTAICRRAPDPRRRGFAALRGGLIGLALVSAFAVAQYVTRFRLHPRWVADNPDLVRAHATLDDPNSLAAYLVLGLGVAVGVAMVERTGWSRRVAMTIGGLALLALGTTVSRGAWGAVVLAAPVVLALWRRPDQAEGGALRAAQVASRRALVVLAVLALVWAIARGVLPSRPAGRPAGPVQAVLTTIDPRVPLDDVLKDRDRRWRAALRMSNEEPIVGVGLGRFPRLSLQYDEESRRPENAHNLYLQLLAETGLVGLAAIGFLLLAGAQAIRRAAASSLRGNHLALGLAGGVVAFLVTLLTGHALLLPSGQLLFATTFAAGLAAVGAPGDGEGSSSAWRRGALGLCLLAAASYPAAALGRGFDARGDPWGYHVGLYPTEQDSEWRRYRWTAARAILHLTVPPGAEALTLQMSAEMPIRDGGPTRVTIAAGGQTHELERHDSAWERLRIPLPEENVAPQPGRIVVEIEVEPTLVPAETMGSDDQRTLGVVLRPPRFRPLQRR